MKNTNQDGESFKDISRLPPEETLGLDAIKPTILPREGLIERLLRLNDTVKVEEGYKLGIPTLKRPDSKTLK